MDFESKCYWARRIFGNYNSSDNNANMAEEPIYSVDDFKNDFNSNDDNQFDFLFNSGKLHIAIIDNHYFFIGKEVAEYLEYRDIRRALELVPDEYKLTITSRKNIDSIQFIKPEISNGEKGRLVSEAKKISNRFLDGLILEADQPNLRNQLFSGLTFICANEIIGPSVSRIVLLTEYGVYRLCTQSTKPNAEKFRQWIETRVLPSIRQTGMYMTPQAITDARNSDNPSDFIFDRTEAIRDITNQARNYFDAVKMIHEMNSNRDRMVDSNGNPVTNLPLIFTSGYNFTPQQQEIALGIMYGEHKRDELLTRIDNERKKNQRAVSKLREEKKDLIAENTRLKNRLLDNGISLDGRRNMCSVIPDDIRGKLSYEEYRKINPRK